MKLLTGIVALVVLISATPAFAGDASADRNWAQKKERRAPSASVQTETQQMAETKTAKAVPCACDCMTHNDQHPAGPR